jgi:hypothetical protein
LAPSSESKNKPSKKQCESRWQVVLYMSHSSTLNIEAKCCSKTSVDFQRTNGLISQKIERTPHNESRGKFVKYEEFSSGTQCHLSRTCYLLHADFLLGLIFHPEDEFYLYHRKFDWLSTDSTALYPKRWNSSYRTP